MSIINVWLALSPQKQITAAVSVIATIGALFLLTSTALKPQTDLLYSGLDPAAAGEVVAKLEALGVVYEVKGNAIYADKSRRDSLRLELAKDGLPRQSTVGYELFDNLNSFAMTSDMFDTAYWRAKEGELARTLMAMPSVRTARVHLGTQKAKGFNSSAAAHTASVTIASSGGISPAQAKAIQYMTALSVSGLKPSDVAVIDTVGGVIAGPGINDGQKGGMGEVEKAAQIKQNLLSMLEARVGRGNARVSVSLDFEREHLTIAERRYDPDSRVLKSQTSREMNDTATGTNDNVTVASNLPEGEAGGNQNNSDREETSETVTYEISEIIKNSEILPGGVKRMSVAVLLNDIIASDGDGNITRSERDSAELTALTELISSASGIDAERGDIITVKSLPFEVPPLIDGVERPSLFSQFMERYLWSMIQALILAVVVLVLAIFVVRPLLSPQKPQNTNGLEPLSLSGPDTQNTPGGGMDMASNPALALSEPMALPFDGPMAMADFSNSNAPEDPIDLLKSTVSDQTQAAADLLAQWLDQDAEAINNG